MPLVQAGFASAGEFNTAGAALQPICMGKQKLPLQPARLLTLLFGAMAGLRRTTYKWPSLGIEHYIFLFFIFF